MNHNRVKIVIKNLFILNIFILIFHCKSTEVIKLQTYTNNIGMEFVLIPPGEFEMGCVEGEDKLCRAKVNTVKDRKKVTIGKPFYIGKYEVTQGQWKKIMGKNPSFDLACGDDCPVENVSWEEIQLFIKKINQVDPINNGLDPNLKYRLPTETEWEYAARAGVDSPFQEGDEFSPKYSWSIVNSGERIHPVGGREPNRFGLYDMIGNVWEWCEDSFVDYFSEDDKEGLDELANDDKVLRGGSFAHKEHALTFSYRDTQKQFVGDRTNGVRLVIPYFVPHINPEEPLNRVSMNKVKPDDIAPLPAQNGNVPIMKTGQQKTLYMGDDGNYQIGKLKGYEDKGNLTVQDKISGLVWQKCSAGLSGNECQSGSIEKLSWEKAMTYCKSSKLANRKWRLPELKELQSLVHYGEYKPAIDKKAFPNTGPSYYWSKTQHIDKVTMAWYTNFSFGNVLSIDKANEYYVRCVAE